MKHTWKVAVAAAVLAGSAGVAKADLTLDGQTGLFANPTAEIVQKDAPEVALNFNRLSANGQHANGLGVGFAFQPTDKLELNAGFTRLSADGIHITDSRFGLKYQFINNTDKGLDVAAGVNYGNSVGALDQITLFAAATKGFNVSSNRSIKGTLGLRWDRFSAPGFSTSKASVYAGADVPLTEKLSVIGEFGTEVVDQGSSTYAIGVRYHPNSSGFSAAIGYGRLANSGYLAYVPSGDSFNNLFAQVGYSFGSN